MLDLSLATASEACATLGQRLREQRLVRLLSQNELAERAGVSVGTVRTLERSGQSSTDSLVRVALALGLADQLQGLFVLPVHSIAQMQRAEQAKRQRAPRRRPG